MVEQRMPSPPLNSLDLLFKPESAVKFVDSGISMIDLPDEILTVALNYLSRSPHRAEPEDLQAASGAGKAVNFRCHRTRVSQCGWTSWLSL